MLNKIGTPQKINIVKQSAFQVDLNVLATILRDKWPDKSLSVNELHEALKGLGVIDYQAEDMQTLVGRLQAIGFKITENV
jgi:hypothetical protein